MSLENGSVVCLGCGDVSPREQSSRAYAEWYEYHISEQRCTS
jgi:hypothetical protein